MITIFKIWVIWEWFLMIKNLSLSFRKKRTCSIKNHYSSNIIEYRNNHEVSFDFFTACCYWRDWWYLATPLRWMCAESVDSWDTRAGASSVNPRVTSPLSKCPTPVNCCSRSYSPWILCQDFLLNVTMKCSTCIIDNYFLCNFVQNQYFVDNKLESVMYLITTCFLSVTNVWKPRGDEEFVIPHATSCEGEGV